MDDPELARELMRRCREQADNTAGLIEQLSILMFDASFSRLIRDDVLPHVQEPLQTMLAILVFDTELVMVGFSTLLRNSTGQLLPSILPALDRIGADADAARVRAGLAYLATQNITPHSLRYGGVPRQVFDVSSLSEDQPEIAPEVWEKLDELVSGLKSEHQWELAKWFEARN